MAYAAFAAPWILQSGGPSACHAGAAGEAKRAIGAMHRLVLRGLLRRGEPSPGPKRGRRAARG